MIIILQIKSLYLVDAPEKRKREREREIECVEKKKREEGSPSVPNNLIITTQGIMVCGDV